MSVAYYPQPEIIRSLPEQGHVVVEASAGTGKTYTLEHLLINLLLKTPGLLLEEVLVVTFTERATRELRVRIRHILERLRRLERRPDSGRPTPEGHWRIDDEVVARLDSVIAAFDAAPIYTIHGFCQRALTEHAFSSRRPLKQELIDARAAFEDAFRRAIRRSLARSSRYRDFLKRWLIESTLESLETLLFRCHSRHGELWPSVNLERIEASLAQLQKTVAEAGGVEALCALWKQCAIHGQDLKSLEKTLFPALGAVVEDGVDLPTRLHRLESIALSKLHSPRVKKKAQGALLFPDDLPEAAKAVRDAIRALEEVRVPFSSAMVQLCLPPVREALAEVKRERGGIDFDDMLLLVHEALRGEHGETFRDILRGQYRFALIDEFQDTDPIQWEIFRALFVDDPDERSRLFVIGDPKQAIYSFRGADVRTYLRARDVLVNQHGGVLRHLEENHRSTAPLVEACNLIFDQTAKKPLFSGDITYDHPVYCGQPRMRATFVDEDGGAVEAHPVVLMKAEADGAHRLPALRKKHGRRIALEISTLLGEAPLMLSRRGEAPRRVRANEIFILTRSNQEALEASRYLRERKIPYHFFKIGGLFETPEALDIVDLFQAIAAPGDKDARLKAWSTPFFSVPLELLEACLELPETHPMMARLLRWHALARAQRYEELIPSVIAESGLVRRALFFKDNERELTNYLHILELLLDEVSRARMTPREIVLRLQAFIEGRRMPKGASEGALQRFESDQDAVQIMSIHKSKGLEGSVVFLFGGLTSPPSTPPYLCYDAEGRRLIATTRDASLKRLVSRENEEENQRLLYVAMTRARARVYLPLIPLGALAKRARIDGTYAQLNARLLAAPLAEHPARFEVVSLEAREERKPREEVDVEQFLGSQMTWSPSPSVLNPAPPRAELDQLRGRRLLMTSYTRMKKTLAQQEQNMTLLDLRDFVAEQHGPPLRALLDDDTLPRGAAAGILLHDLLENVQFSDVLVDRGDLNGWRRRPEIRRLLDATFLRQGIDVDHREVAAQLVYNALVTPLEMGTARLDQGLCACQRVLKEMEFVYPIPEQHHPRVHQWTSSMKPIEVGRGFIKGFIDLVFEHEGRVYIADWKSDLLADYDLGALDHHVKEFYHWQSRLYTLAVVKMLRAFDPQRYEERFGGVLYLFLRGLSPERVGEGAHFERLSWDDLLAFEENLIAVNSAPQARRPRA